ITMRSLDHPNVVLTAYGHLLSRAKGDQLLAYEMAKAGHYGERIVEHAKNAVTATGLNNQLYDTSAVTGFYDAQRSRSVFPRLIADGAMQTVPPNTRVVSVTTAPKGYTRTAPGYPIQASSMVLSDSQLNLKTAVGVAVLS